VDEAMMKEGVCGPQHGFVCEIWIMPFVLQVRQCYVSRTEKLTSVIPATQEAESRRIMI
jgi:hypothetical protein